MHAVFDFLGEVDTLPVGILSHAARRSNRVVDPRICRDEVKTGRRNCPLHVHTDLLHVEVLLVYNLFFSRRRSFEVLARRRSRRNEPNQRKYDEHDAGNGDARQHWKRNAGKSRPPRQRLQLYGYVFPIHAFTSLSPSSCAVIRLASESERSTARSQSKA